MMLSRLPLPLVLAAIACGGGPSTPDPLEPDITGVDGAVHPMLVAGREFTVTGFGFGANEEGRALFVTTSSGQVAAEVVDWNDEAITARLPDDAVSGSIAIAIAPGDTLGPVPMFVRVYEPFDPAVLSWKAGPVALRALAALPVTTLRYPAGATLATVQVLVGGAIAGGGLTDSTYFGFGSETGGIASWVSAPDTVVPVRRRLHAVVAVDRTRSRLDIPDIEGAAYLIGGLDQNGAPLATVEGIGIQSDGAYGLWTPFSLLPERRAGARALATRGNVFVVGGFGGDSVATADVFVATVQHDGRLNGWFRGPPLPEPLALGALVVVGETLYYLGGETGAVNPDSTDPASPNLRATVWALRLSPRTGFPQDTGWTDVGPMVTARSRHAAFGLDGGILVTGGVYVGAPSAVESEFAVVGLDGTVGAFATVAAQTIADLGGGALRDMAFTTAWDSRGVPHPLIVGGRSSGDSVLAATWWH